MFRQPRCPMRPTPRWRAGRPPLLRRTSCTITIRSAHVAAAWVEFFDDQSTYGVLELEIERALDAAVRHDFSVPDYYVVIHPEVLPVTWKHWWLGVLSSASPSRVIPWPSADDSLAELLRRLPTARAWPEVDAWLPKVRGAIPDRVGLPGAG